MLNIKEDYHIHCSYNDHSSKDLTVPNILLTAKKLGLEKIAITEHVRRTSEWTDVYIKEIESFINYTNIEVLKGFEAKILPNGEIDCPNQYLTGNFFIIASFHTKYEKETWLNALIKTINNPFVNVIGHLAPEIGFSISENEIKKIGEELHSNEKIVEINAKYKRPPVDFLTIFKDMGIRFHLGSDAHSLNEIGNFSRINDLINLIENK